MGLTIDPTFSYNKGQVWLFDQALTKMCVQQGNLNVDRRFTIMFKDRVDARDLRPMTMGWEDLDT